MAFKDVFDILEEVYENPRVYNKKYFVKNMV